MMCCNASATTYLKVFVVDLPLGQHLGERGVEAEAVERTFRYLCVIRPEYRREPRFR